MEVSICVVIQNVHEMQNIGDQVPLLERLHRSAINTLIAEEYFVSLIAADDLVLLFDLNETFWGNNHFLQAISIDLPSDQNLLKVFNPKTGFKVSEAYISYLKRIEHLPEVPIEMTVSSNDVWNG